MPNRGKAGTPMKHRGTYTYVLLRYRHDPLVGEFANVGVLLQHAQTGILHAKFRKTIGRLARMFPNMDADLFRASLRKIDRAVTERNKIGGDLLLKSGDAEASARRILPNDDSSFFWSDLGSGLTDNVSKTADQLYERFVAMYDEHPHSHRDDAAVWRPIREKLTEKNLIDKLQSKVIVSPVDKIEFEHAWKNGAWHCYLPLSFDLVSEDNIREKAARWTGHMHALKTASEDFKPYFLVGAPTDPKLRGAYLSAIGILKLSPQIPKIIEESQFDELVEDIEDRMRSSAEDHSS